MTSLTLPAIPGDLHWKNDPVDWNVDQSSTLSITSGVKTDWFADPSGSGFVSTNAPAALFAPPDEKFLLSARVTVDFAATYDAGVLFLYERDDLWAKLCFEYSPQKQPMVVSVVTRGLSDDCNSVPIDGSTVYYRVARTGAAFVFHYSLDGAYWNFVRHFTLGKLENLRVGFLSQSPTGAGCTVSFAEIAYRQGTLNDLRSGE